MANGRCFQTLTRSLAGPSAVLRPRPQPNTHRHPPHYIFVNNFHACQRATVLTRKFSLKPMMSRMTMTTMRNTMKVKKMRMKRRPLFYLLRIKKKIFKPHEPVFAVVRIGYHQFKVSNEDTIFTERLKFCNVNDKLVLKGSYARFTDAYNHW